MPLGTEVGLGPGHIALDGEQARSPTARGTAAPPLFDPCLLWPSGRSSHQLMSDRLATIDMGRKVGGLHTK